MAQLFNLFGAKSLGACPFFVLRTGPGREKRVFLLGSGLRLHKKCELSAPERFAGELPACMYKVEKELLVLRSSFVVYETLLFPGKQK